MKSAILENIQYGSEVRKWLSSFLAPDRTVSGPHYPETMPGDIEQVIGDIHDIWNARGFLHPRDLNELLLDKYIPEASPAVRALIQDIDAARHVPDSMTGLLGKEHTALVTGLGHLYAALTREPIAVVECDFWNMDGTNHHNRARIARERGVDIEEVDLREAFQLTDRTARLLTLQLLHDIRQVAPEATLVAMRAGGDELRFIVGGIAPESHAEIVRTAHESCENHIARLGLMDHPHPKDTDDPVRNGFGIAFAVQDLRDIPDRRIFIETLNARIIDQKTALGQQRLGIFCDAQIREDLAGFYAMNPSRLPSGGTADEVIDYVIESYRESFARRRAELEALRPGDAFGVNAQRLYIDSRLQHLGDNQEIDTRGQLFARPDTRNLGLPDFSHPMAHRIAHMHDYLRRHSIETTPAEQHFIDHAIRSITVIDPSTGTYMPREFLAAMEIYARDTARLRNRLRIAASADLPLQARVIGVSFHNQGALNNALGHENANGVLRHMACEIIGGALANAGLNADDYVIGHYGAGEFRIVTKPCAVSAEDGITRPVTDEMMRDIQCSIAARTCALNRTRIRDFLTDKGLAVSGDRLEEIGDMTFGQIKASKTHSVLINGEKVEARLDGMHVVTHTAAVPDNAGVEFLRSFAVTLSEKNDLYRARYAQEAVPGGTRVSGQASLPTRFLGSAASPGPAGIFPELPETAPGNAPGGHVPRKGEAALNPVNF